MRKKHKKKTKRTLSFPLFVRTHFSKLVVLLLSLPVGYFLLTNFSIQKNSSYIYGADHFFIPYDKVLKSLEATPLPYPQTTPVNDFCLTVPIILYHHIEPLSLATKAGHEKLTVDSGIFEEQMRYIAENGYTTLHAEELVDALTNHTSLPEKPIMITIDDGYLDNFIYAFAILEKYKLKGNFMIPTGLVGNSGYMTWEHVQKISASPYGFIYNHTWSHFPLDQGDKQKIETEILTAKKQLETYIDHPSSSILTYPYGQFNDTVIQVLKNNQFTAAFSTIHGTVQCESFLYALRRNHVGNAPLSSYGL